MQPIDTGTGAGTVAPAVGPSGDVLLEKVIRGLLRTSPKEARRGAWRPRNQYTRQSVWKLLKLQIQAARSTNDNVDGSQARLRAGNGNEILELLRSLGTKSSWRSGRNGVRGRRG